MIRSETKVVIAWLLLVPIIASNIKNAFAAYRVDAKLWKLLIHAVVLTCFGWLIVDVGVFCLNLQFDLRPPSKSQFAMPKLCLKLAKAAPLPARAAPAHHKPGHKK